MLYPDFSDLLSYKKRKLDKMQPSHRKVSSRAPGNHHSPYRGPGLDFDAVREYVPGDDIRNIDWRVTARTGSPHVKLFQQEKERHTIICVDMNSAMRFGTRNTFKSVQAARCASLLGWRALAHQDRISACFFGDVPGGLQYFASKHTRQALSTVLKMLVQPPIEQHQVSLEAALQHIGRTAHSGSLIYLISDFMDLSANFSNDPTLSRLTKICEVVFVSINDAADKALAAAGVIGFYGRGSEKVYVDTNSFKGRETYAAEWQASRSILTSTAKRLKIPVIELSTESDIHSDLLLGLKNSSRGK